MTSLTAATTAVAWRVLIGSVIEVVGALLPLHCSWCMYPHLLTVQRPTFAPWGPSMSVGLQMADI